MVKNKNREDHRNKTYTVMIVENIPWNVSVPVWDVIFDENTLHMELITQWAFYSFLFLHRCNAKFLIVFIFHYSLVTKMADRSHTSTGLSVHVFGGLQSAYTASNCFVSKKTILKCSFNTIMTTYLL